MCFIIKYIYIYIYIYDSFQCMTKPTTIKKRDLQKCKKKMYIYIYNFQMNTFVQ